MNVSQKKIKLQPAINRFIESLKKYKIQFEEMDGYLNNVVFTLNGKKQKLAHEIFYRCSGRCCMVKTNKKGEDIIVPMDDDSFYTWLKLIILHGFKIETI